MKITFCTSSDCSADSMAITRSKIKREMKNLLAGAILMAPDLGLPAAHAKDMKNIDAPYVPKVCSADVTIAPSDVANDP